MPACLFRTECVFDDCLRYTRDYLLVVFIHLVFSTVHYKFSTTTNQRLTPHFGYHAQRTPPTGNVGFLFYFEFRLVLCFSFDSPHLFIISGESHAVVVVAAPDTRGILTLDTSRITQ